MAEAEELLEDHFQFQLGAPAEVLRIGKRNAVPVIDLRKHIAVGGIDQMSAQHAGEAVAGKHGAFAGAAAGHHIVRRSGVQQQGGKQAALHISQLGLILRAVHPVIVHRMPHGLDNFPQRGLDQAVLGRLAVFIDQRNTHFHSILSSWVSYKIPFPAKKNKRIQPFSGPFPSSRFSIRSRFSMNSRVIR